MTDANHADAMRRLSDDERAEAIGDAPNVVGFERFRQKAQQVALREGYRAPQKPGPGGTA